MRFATRRNFANLSHPANKILAFLTASLMVVGVLQASEAVSTTTSAQAANAACSSTMASQSGLVAIPSHGSVMYIDSGVSPKVDAAYVGYQVKNTSGSTKTKLWVSLESFTGGKVSLANPADQYQEIPSLANNATTTVFYLLKSTGSTITAQTHTVKVYDKRPDLTGATAQMTCDFKFNKVVETIKASANKVNTVTSALSPTTATLGGTFTVNVTSAATGKVGQGSAPDYSAFWSSPAGVSSWPTRSLRLESTSIVYQCPGTDLTLSNRLFINGTELTNCTTNNTSWTAAYTYRIIGPGPAAVTPAPVAFISSGTQYKHSDLNGITASAVNLSGVASTAVGVTVSAQGTEVANTATSVTIEYTVTISTTSTAELRVDEIVDSHGAGTSYVAGSTKMGTTVAGATTAADPLSLAADSSKSPPPYHFIGPFSVVAGTNYYIVYRFTVPCSTSLTDYSTTVVAYTGDVLIGSGATTASTATVQTQTTTGTCTYTLSTANVSLEPSVSTSPASGINSNSATINGFFNAAGNSPVNYRYVWGTDPNLANAALITTQGWSAITGSSPASMPSTLSGVLNASTTYFFQAQIQKSGGTLYKGSILSFTTDAVVATPSVTTLTAQLTTTAGTVILNGSVNPNLNAVTSVYFYYRASNSDLTTGTTAFGPLQMSDGTATGTVDITLSGSGTTYLNSTTPAGVDISGLTVGTTYYYKIRANCTVSTTCPAGYVDGTTVSFTVGAPSVDTSAATDIAATTATLGGTVSGSGSVTYSLRYCPAVDASCNVSAIAGTVSETTPITTSAPSAVAYTGAATSLVAGATYYFQAQASVTNGANTYVSYGPILSFTTLKISTASPLANGTVGSTYATSFAGVGGSGSYKWTTATPPAGLLLSDTGVLSGTPTTAGSFTFTVTMTDTSGISTTKDFTIVINATITYSGNGNTGGSVPANTVGYGSTALAGHSALVKAGYTFGGWLIDGVTYPDTTTNYNLTATVTATAVWTAETYTVTFNKNTATGTDPTSVNFVVGTTSPLTLPNATGMTKTGYDLTGWSTDAGINGAGGAKVATPYTPSASVTLYAVWTPINYTITYDRNGSTGTNATQSLVYGDTTALSYSPGWNRTGYTFLGWSTSNTANTADASFTVSGAATLYAVWSINSYTITYAKNDGSGSTATQDLEYGSTAGLTFVHGFTRTGYTFAGWSETAGGVTALTSYTVSGAATLYAIWQGDTYTITYDSNTAGGTASRTSDSYIVGTSSDITLPTVGSMTLAGYSFVGWSIGAGASGAGTGAVANPYHPTGSVTLYAIWSSAPVHVVTFNANYVGSAPDATQSGTASTNLVGNPFIRSGYTFGGWADSTANATAGTVAYADLAAYSFTADVTLYAIWTPDVYVITYDANTALGSPSKATENFTVGGTAITLIGSTGMNKTGHSFGGWSTSAGSRTALPASYSPTQSRTVYAIWIEDVYRITYDYKGGEAGDAFTDYTFDTPAYNLPSSTRSGYTFGGWSTTDGGTQDATSPYTPTQSRTLYARWIADVYTITYDYLGGALSGGTETGSFTYDSSPITLPTCAKSTKVFGGWSLTSGGTSSVGSTYSPTSNVILYAIWNDVAANTVTFNSNYSGGPTATTQSSAVVANLTLNGFSRIGYTFSAWSNSSAAGATADYTDGQSFDFATSKTLFALWTPNVYTITYDYLGGSATRAYDNYTVGTAGLSTPSSSRSDFTFGGWSLTNGGTTPIANPYQPGASITVYAIWTAVATPPPSNPAPTIYIITFVYQGGSATVSALGYTAGQAPVALPTTNRKGYTFTGWCLLPKSFTPVSNPFTTDRDVTLYANWDGNTVTVRFDYQGGTEGIKSASYKVGEPGIALPSTTRTGFENFGWATAINGAPAVDNPYSPIDDVTLFALWQGKTFTLKLNLPTSTTPTVMNYTTGDAGVNLPVLTRPGYEFVGWSSKAVTTTGSIKNYKPVKDEVLWAVWKNIPANTKVYFGGDSPVLLASEKKTLQKLAQKVLVNTQRPQMIVNGWVKATSDASYDLRLSNQRATNTVAFLKALGVDAFVSKAAKGISPENTDKSRRTDVQIYFSGPASGKTLTTKQVAAQVATRAAKFSAPAAKGLSAVLGG
mgnify:CR=1 FL=1